MSYLASMEKTIQLYICVVLETKTNFAKLGSLFALWIPTLGLQSLTEFMIFAVPLTPAVLLDHKCTILGDLWVIMSP